MKAKRYYWVVVTDDRNIEAADRKHAEWLYDLYKHATLERWDVVDGTARQIKTK